MEEFNISKYQEAPYLELDDYKAPKGIKSYFVNMDDGIKIRVCHWLQKGEKNTGTVFLQQGHNEFIEKYYETIKDFLDLGLNVICFDWRGQGMSDKVLKDKSKQHINDFKIHDDDLTFIIENILSRYFPKPYIAIGHSMGGCILLSNLNKHHNVFSKMILSAPMLGFKFEFFLNFLTRFSQIFLKDDDYFLGSKPNYGKETLFDDNELTNDKDRYNRTLKLVRKKPEIRLWGVTTLWAIAVINRLKLIRETDWSKIKTNLLFINCLDDKVVSQKSIVETSKLFKNSKLIQFKDCKHEVFMEKDKTRLLLWREINTFLDDII